MYDQPECVRRRNCGMRRGVQRGSSPGVEVGGRGRRSWRRGQIKGGNPGKVAKSSLPNPSAVGAEDPTTGRMGG